MKKSICKKFDFIFSLLVAAGSLGTVIAVIITYYTLKEIQKQRIKANQPELVINNGIIGLMVNVISDG
jgi:predicted membrane protein